MKFCHVQGTPKIVHKIFEIFFQNRPKIHSKSIPEALQNNPRKRHAKKHQEITKNIENGHPKGVPGGTSNVVFVHVAPLEANMAPRRPPRALQTPANLNF